MSDDRDLHEDIIYDAYVSILENSKRLCELVNKHGTDEDKKAYRNGVYATAIKLEVVLGTEGIERGKKRYEDLCERMRQHVENAKKNDKNKEKEHGEHHA